MATIEAADILARGASATPRIGLILLGSQEPIFGVFRQGLNQLGYMEGQNIAFEPRAAQGQLDRIPAVVAELVSLDVAVIVATGAVSAQAARTATTKIPIVFSAVIDPIAVGFATTLERPGGNITGITSFDPQQPTRQFELLKEVFPQLSRVAILSDEDIPRAADGGLNPLERANDAAARALGLQPQWLRVKGPTPDHESVFAAMSKEGAEALVVLEVPVNVFFHQKRIAELAAMHRLPTLFPGGWHSAEMGGLIAYGTSFHDTLPRLPQYVDKILKGADPGELPIEVINRCELGFNLQTARAIGVTVPPELLTRADRIIE